MAKTFKEIMEVVRPTPDALDGLEPWEVWDKFQYCFDAAQAARRERSGFLLTNRAEHIEMVLEEEKADGSLSLEQVTRLESVAKALHEMSAAILADTGDEPCGS